MKKMNVLKKIGVIAVFTAIGTGISAMLGAKDDDEDETEDEAAVIIEEVETSEVEEG